MAAAALRETGLCVGRDQWSRHEGFRAIAVLTLLLPTFLLLAACGAEKRAVGPTPPMTAPTGLSDPRQARMENNIYDVSEGGRMFRWFGCDSCHKDAGSDATNLADGQWRHGGSTAQIYASIDRGQPDGMPAYAGRITSQQMWQIAGYLHKLPQVPPAKRRRQAADQEGEPSGDQWSGALR